ncbi:hypothetical protein [Pedobacter sp. NJ-S-72]
MTRDENKDPAKNAAGTYLANTAKHITNGWLSYRFRNTNSIFNGVGFSGGYQMQFGRYAGSGPTQTPFADYIRFDAGVSYVRGKFSISALVSNLLDRKLFTQGSYTKLAKETPTAVSYYTYIYEVPRNGRISVKYNF